MTGGPFTDRRLVSLPSCEVAYIQVSGVCPMKATGCGLLVFSVALSTSLTIAEEARSADVGDSWSALPGLHRAPLMALSKPRLSAAFTTGYGLTLVDDGSHHRLLAVPAVGLVAAPWLEFALLADTRYDIHPGGDTGFISDPKAVAKVGAEVARNVQLGGQLGVWFPGTEKPGDTFQAASPELSLFGAWTGKPLVFSAYAGYRLDQSKNAGRNAPRLSQGDRLALGLSEFNELLAGAGGAYVVGPWVVLGEVSVDVPMGSGAPGLTESPLRASGGIRYRASAQLEFEGMFDTSLSTPPPVGPTRPLVPVEPRIAGLFGIRYRFVSDPPYVAPVTPTPEEPIAKPKPAPKVVVKTSITVVLRGRDGQLLTDAKVQLITPAGELPVEPDEQGEFLLKDIEVGSVTLNATVAGYVPISKTLVLARDPLKLELNLEPTLTGQVRGLVRSFGGAAVKARISIQPGNLEMSSDADGTFELDVAPGTYEVTINAAGFLVQKKKVVVEKDGVVVMNADLVKK